jgi:hypothetical protein
VNIGSVGLAVLPKPTTWTFAATVGAVDENALGVTADDDADVDSVVGRVVGVRIALRDADHVAARVAEILRAEVDEVVLRADAVRRRQHDVRRDQRARAPDASSTKQDDRRIAAVRACLQ